MNPQERAQLKDYIEICESLNLHRFFKETEVLTLKLDKRSPDSHSLQGYDEDLLKSFLMDFRKLVMNDEPTYFYKVANVISRRKIKLRTVVGKVKTRYENKSKGNPILLESPSKKLDIVDAWINGKYFHQDKELGSAIQREVVLKKQQFIATVIDLSAIAIELAGIARKALGTKGSPNTKNSTPTEEEIAQSNTFMRGQDIADIANKLSRLTTQDKPELSHYEQIRLYLYSTGTLYGNYLRAELLDNHELHIAYTYREKIHLYFEESWLIFKTLISDVWDQKAGWFWYPQMTKKSVLSHATKYLAFTDSENVRLGVINLLSEYWNKEYESLLEKYATDDARSVREKVLLILEKHRLERPLKILDILLKDKEENIRKRAFEQQIDYLIKTDHRRALTLLKATQKLDDYHIKNLEALLKKLGRQELDELLTLEHESLKIFSRRELMRRGAYSESDLENLLKDTQWEVRYFALDELVKKEKSYVPAKVEEILKEDKSVKVFLKYAYGLSSLDKDDILRQIHSAKLPEELEKMIDWTVNDGPMLYELLGRKSFQRLKTEIRTDLSSSFAEKKRTWKERSAAKFKMTLDELGKIFDQYEDLITDKFRVAAVKVLLDHGNSSDIVAARKIAETDSYELKRLAISLIKKFGSAKDSLLLLDVARAGNMYNDRAITGALTLDDKGKNKIIQHTLLSENESHKKRALTYAYNHKKVIPRKSLEPLLLVENDSTRTYAIAYICLTWSRKELESLLKIYASKERYFYNVVCWLDRVLYAPKPLRKSFEKELREKLAWQDSDPRPDSYRRFFSRKLRGS